MFLSLIKFFRGYLLVRLSGYSPERFINLCSNHDILIWNLSCKDNFYEFNISIDGYRKLKPLLRKTKTRLAILGRFGFPFFLYRNRKRKAYFAGIALCIGILVYLTTFVWLIDINGNSAITDESILSFLEKKGSSFGVKKREIDCEGLEEALRTEYGEIIWASVRLEGAKMTIDLQENLVTKQKTEEEKEKLAGAFDIVADKDAVIASIITRRGAPKVKAGDVVEAGDVLVASQLDIYDDNNEIASHIYVAGDADIYGQTAYSFEDSFPLRYVKKERSGEGKSAYEFSLFSYQVSLPSIFRVEEPYISYTESRQLAIAKDYYLPAAIEKTTYYPCVYRQITLSEDEARERAEEISRKHAEKLEKEGIQVTDRKCAVDFQDGQCVCGTEIAAIEKIGRYEPAERAETSEGEASDREE